MRDTRLHDAQLLLQRLAEPRDRALVRLAIDLLARLAPTALVCVQQTRDAAVKAAHLLPRRDRAHGSRDPVRVLRVAHFEPLDDTARHGAVRQPSA